MSEELRPFHLAVPVDDLATAEELYCVVLDMSDWEQLAKRLESADCDFLISPRGRFRGEVGEQATMFLHDPAGNALEFKSFADNSQPFAT